MNKTAVTISLAVVFFAIIIGYSINNFEKSNKEILFSDPVWECDYQNKKWVCLVDFNIRNQTHKDIFGKLSIRGLALRKADRKTTDIMSDDMVIDFELTNYEEKEINETIYSNRRPTKIIITILDENKKYE